MSRIRLDDPRYYFNRHESWLGFNRRVLEEALDESNPLLERVKFLAITASNLDEFVEVRVAGLLQQVEHGNQVTGPDGLSPTEQLQRLAREYILSWPTNTSAGTRNFCLHWPGRASASCQWRVLTGPAKMRWTCFSRVRSIPF